VAAFACEAAPSEAIASLLFASLVVALFFFEPNLLPKLFASLASLVSFLFFVLYLKTKGLLR
jgi:hypothetical protein